MLFFSELTLHARCDQNNDSKRICLPLVSEACFAGVSLFLPLCMSLLCARPLFSLHLSSKPDSVQKKSQLLSGGFGKVFNGLPLKTCCKTTTRSVDGNALSVWMTDDKILSYACNVILCKQCEIVLGKLLDPV